MIFSVVAACLGTVGLFPCLGWLNWFAMPGGAIAFILCCLGVLTEGRDLVARNRAVIGIVISVVTLFVGLIRLILGGGIV